MTSQLSGYAILIVSGMILYAISVFAGGKRQNSNISSYLLANRSIPCGLIASSVFVSWTWTTTIMGAAEAGMWYGVSGGLSYSIGAGIPFLIFVPLVLRLKKIIPQGVTYTEFIGERYGKRAKDVYFVFAVLVVVYVFLEQLVGVGLVFRNIFGVSFKLTVITVALIVLSYIIRGGIKGAFFNNIFHFLIIFFFLGIIVFSLTERLQVGFFYNGLIDASQNRGNPNYNESILMINSIHGLKYGLIALVVALGQVFLDQGYYSIAMAARSRRDLMIGFVMGAVIVWLPVPILSANLFGHGAVALNLAPGHGINSTTDIATTILSTYGSPILCIIFAVMIFSISASTGGNCLLGLLSVFTIDFYSSILRPKANDTEKIRFGKIITICIAVLCASIAIALEDISLLKIDMFSGIFFAAPCCTLIAGLYLRYANETIALLATFLGLTAGLTTWINFGLSSEGWFYSCLLSFITPVLVILISFPFTKERFNFARLRFYKSDSDQN